MACAAVARRWANMLSTTVKATMKGVTVTQRVALNWDKVQDHRAKTSAQLVGGVEGLLAANGVTVLSGWRAPGRTMPARRS